jgi:hypothetical protein
MNSSVNYYRVNANNRSISTSNSGLGTTSPTEEITPPVTGGTYASGGGTTTIVCQAGSSPTTLLAEGQYLYYINNLGEYVLMGQIATLDPLSPLNIVLSSVISYTNPTAGDAIVGSYYLITVNESIFVRIATDTVSSPNKVLIPDFNYWRTANNVSAINNPTYISIARISNVGVPLSTAASIQQINFTFTTQNIFTLGTGNNSNRAWPSTTDFPAYIWIRLTFTGANINLAPKTLYRFITQETFPHYEADVLTPIATLQGIGYSI